MANYAWRVGTGDLGIAANWSNTTTGANPAITVPGAADTVNFNATSGGTVSGTATLTQLNVNAGAAAPWAFTGGITANWAFIDGAASFASGSRLTLNGTANPGFLPNAGRLNGPVSLTGATLDASGGTLTIGSANGVSGTNPGLSVLAGSAATALGAAVGNGRSGALTVSGAGSTFRTIVNTPLDTASAKSGYLTLGQRATVNGVTTTGQGTLTVNNGGVVNIDNGLNDGLDDGSAGYASVSGGGTIYLNGGSAFIGNLAGSSGTLAINAGSSFISTQPAQSANYVLVIGGNSSAAGATGLVSVDGAGALLDLRGSGATIGQVGTGSLTISNGGTAKLGTSSPGTNSTTAALALARAGTATVTVDGAGSSLQLAGTVYAGRATGSSASITVTNHASLVQTSIAASDAVAIGNSGTTNNVLVSGGTASLTVASASTATLANQLYVGTNGAHGTVTVTGANSTLSDAGQIYVGGGSITTFTGGSGVLNVLAGGVLRDTAAADVTSSYLVVGNNAAGSGTVLVDGAGSLLDMGANAASIAIAGTGSVTVSNGGTARSATPDSRSQAALSLGRKTGATGTLAVTGAGSSYDAFGYVYVGRGGAGAITVDQGGAFTGGKAANGDGLAANAQFAVVIGDATPVNDPVTGVPITTTDIGGTGTVQVKNSSTFRTRGDLFIGYRGGNGTLLVDTGSTASSDRNIQVGTGSERPGGTGAVTIQGGGTLRAGGAHVLASAGISVGVQAGTTGTVTVTGAGSLMDANGDRITVGSRAAGTLNVLAGAHVLSGAQYADTEAAFGIGVIAGSNGVVVVDGAGSMIKAAGAAGVGGSNSGAGFSAGGAGALSVTNGGLFQADSLRLFKAGTITLGQAATIEVGAGPGTAGALTVDTTLIAQGGAINANVIDNGAISNAGGTLSIAGNVTGAGSLALGAGLVTVTGTIANEAVAFTDKAATLRVNSLAGAGTVTGFQATDSIDLTGVTNATLTTTGGVTTVTAGAGSLSLGAAPAGSQFKLFGDGHGGQQVLLDAPPVADGIAITNAATNTSSTATATAYTGPVDYLQQQYIWSGADAVAMAANAPNAFIKGGPAGDALLVTGGNNVLDGGAGSNFLIGASGADGGTDTFFVDSRGSVETWSTIVNFHQGDQATIFGFHPGLSTRPYTANDGAVGYTGLTIHSEINGVGTGIKGSMTFTGIDQATADAHFSITTGTLLPNTPDAIDYLLIQYNR